ncbi:ATP synthase F0, B chain [Candidatus Glomeribacter gigasporarum BEG34]|uniref:ATP synthase subunit b n=1 Tax=Candidatus Glomeribacter gigasporarum BEG34 TaxID=1070319 RepID=G2J8E4_9BURK|nr:F0F1 ATP synthase subunit B [Candidatus Glomeribacter gigasporarum]CCD29041.1 ATP synthase F0, B chain [Candidatus Glomeribacter gigasporarum BEG34]
MNINATLFAQTVVFFILAWVAMRFVWPPLIQAIDARTKKIADGLAAAKQSQAELEIAKTRAQQTLAHAREQGQQTIHAAEQRAQAVAEEIKRNAQLEAERLMAQAKMQVEQQFAQARAALRNEVSDLVVRGAERILQREMDRSAHAALLDQLKATL